SERETHYFNSVLAILLENGADPNGVILDRDEPNEVNNSRSVLSEFSYWSSNANFYNPTALELLSQYGLDPMIKYSMLQENSLMKAIRYEGMSEEVIIKILAYFVQRKELDLEQTSSLGSTLLIIASQVCHPEIVGWLASNGANMNVVGGFDNTTALHKCISNFSHISPVARSATVKILLKHGVDVNELCPGGDGTPIMNAATVGAYQAMVVLIEAGGDVNGSDINGKTAAMCAVNEHGFSYDYEGSMESTKSRILNLLQEHGADLDTFSNGNESALKNAIYYGYRTIFESLLRLNVSTLNPDSNGVTPIMWAIEYGDIYFVERLLTYNPDLSKLDHYGRNVIYSCIFRNNEEEGISLINNFLSKGIRPNDLGNGLNILQIAAMNQRSGYIPILSSLADINAVDEDGKTPIINAITSDTEISDEVIIKTIKSLQDNGGDINLKDSQNRSAFLYAKSMERLYLAGKLKELGANASDGDIYINIL
ncbi:MAG: ankyrin repeat domain-containing protein, partial [Pontiella sp.]